MSGQSVLRQGDTGPEVLELQLALAALGMNIASVDGTFDGVTDSAVRQFQSAVGLSETGIVDEDTWS